jgi:hypothetical protein
MQGHSRTHSQQISSLILLSRHRRNAGVLSHSLYRMLLLSMALDIVLRSIFKALLERQMEANGLVKVIDFDLMLSRHDFSFLTAALAEKG